MSVRPSICLSVSVSVSLSLFPHWPHTVQLEKVKEHEEKKERGRKRKEDGLEKKARTKKVRGFVMGL